jgi:hypothetical protein
MSMAYRIEVETVFVRILKKTAIAFLKQQEVINSFFYIRRRP